MSVILIHTGIAKGKLLLLKETDFNWYNETTKAVCQMCEEEGVAAIHVSISTYVSLQYCIGSTYLSPGYETAAAAEIKKSVNIPVITVGRYTDPEIAESVVWEGSADMVAFGRQSIADPHFPHH